MKKFVVSAALVAFAVAAVAQYPGQAPTPVPTPYPGGGYPPGTIPPPGSQQGGIPMPTRGKKNKQKQNQIAQRSLEAEGKTVSNDGKKLVIVTEDGRTITMTLTAETKFTRSTADISASKVIPRTTVHVSADEDDDFYLTATHVDLLKDAPPETAEVAGAQRARADAPEDETRPTILHGPVDAPDRPILRRGKPNSAATESSDSSNDQLTATAGAPAARAPKNETGDFTINTDSDQPKLRSTGDELIDRAREWALTFTQGLPNYVCQQDTTRYVEQSRSSGWEPVDVVTAKVIYEDGKEEYKEITVGGKRTNKSMLELGGSTSIGEFASTLRGLFSESTRAEFKPYQSTHVGDTPAEIYDFKVQLRNSDWFTTVGGQTLAPAYSGSVWIEKGSAQVRRIEMEANSIPKDFPVDSVEWAVDYEETSLGTAKYLLPIHAENLACWRGTSICNKNTIDFRDYHKYSGESTITFK